MPVGHRRVQLQGGQLGPEGVGRLHQRGKLVGELDRTPVQQGVELVVELVWLWSRHPHRFLFLLTSQATGVG